MAIFTQILLVLLFFILIKNGHNYKEFTEFEPGETLNYGILDIQNRSDWLPAVQILNDVPTFKQFFLRLDHLNDLVSFLLNYTALSFGGNVVIPYYVHSNELQNPTSVDLDDLTCLHDNDDSASAVKIAIRTQLSKGENVRILHKTAREARFNDFSTSKMPPIYLNANYLSNNNYTTTVFPALQQLGIPLGIFIVERDDDFYSTVTTQLQRLKMKNVSIEALIFYTKLPKPTLLYYYEDFVIYMNRVLKKANILLTERFDLTICVHFAAKTRSLKETSLFTNFFYRWGEDTKCKVIAFWWDEINTTGGLDSYKNLLFKTFRREDTPLIGTVEYWQVPLLGEICERSEELSKLSEIVIKYTQEKQLARVLQTVNDLKCGVQISLQYNYYHGTKSYLLPLDVVLNLLANGIKKHAVLIKGITVSLCEDANGCFCLHKVQDYVLDSFIVGKLHRQNLTVGIMSCGLGLIKYEEILKTLGIKRLIHKTEYGMTIVEKTDDHVNLAQLIHTDANVLNFYYSSWMNSKNIYLDSSLKYYGFSKKENCRLLKSQWNQLFNIATINGFGLAVPLSRLFRFEFDSMSSMKNVSDNRLNHSLALTNIAKCSNLPSFGMDAFEFNANLSGVTFHYNPNRFLTTKEENLALLLEFINQPFKRIELVFAKPFKLEEFNVEPMRKLLGSIQYLRKTLKSDKCEFYFSFENRNLSLHDTMLLINEFRGVVAGIHVSFNPEQEEISKSKNTIYHLKQISELVGIIIEYSDAYHLAQGGFENDVFGAYHYVIIHINIAKVISSNWNTVEPDEVIQEFIEEKLNPDAFYEIFFNLYNWKLLFKDVHPNVTLYTRIAWPTTYDGRSTKAFLSVWKFVHLFSTKYEFPFFVYEAFDNETESDMRYGWWKMRKDSMDPTDLGNYFEKQADHLNLKTKRPQRKLKKEGTKETSTFFWTLTNSILVSVAGAAVLFFVGSIVAFCTIRMVKRVNILTKDEIQEFEMGIVSSEENGKNENHIYGMRYDKSWYEIRRDDFVEESGSIIGQGQFGVVYKYFMSRFNNFVAVKIPNAKEKTQLMSILREIKLMVYLGEHINVVKLLGAYTGEIKSGFVFIVTEYLENGSLLEYLREMRKTEQNDSPVLLRELFGFCADISNGMEYLARKHVIHGDLATRNVLLDGNNVCKISDFGLSKQLYTEAVYVQTTSKPLPWAWLAVETLEQGIFTTKSDVWSMGVTFWEIFALGMQPYPGLRWDVHFPRKLRDGLRLPKADFMTHKIYEEIRKCWTIEPEERPPPSLFALLFGRQKQDTYYSDII